MTAVGRLPCIAFSHFSWEMAKGDGPARPEKRKAPRLAAIALGVAAFLLMPPALAATGAGAVIHNVTTASYDGSTRTVSVDVTVATLAAAPSISVDTTAQTVVATSTATYNYTLVNNSNGVDTFPVTAASADAGTAGPPGLDLNGTGTPTGSFTLGASIANAPSDASGNVYIPAGSETGLSAGDEIVISGVGSYTIATLTPGTTASTAGGVTTPETPTRFTVTPIGAAPVVGAGSVPVGTQIGERSVFALAVTANTPSVAGVDGTHTVNLDGTTTATDAAGAVVSYTTSAADSNETVTTVTSAAVTLTKEVRNVTTGTAFGASGGTVASGDTLEYRVTAAPVPGAADVSGSLIVDEAPANTVFVPGSTTLNGAAVPDGAGATLPTTAANGGLQINSPSGGAGVLVDGESAVLLFRVNVGPVGAATTIDNTANLTFTGGSISATAAASTVVRTGSAIELLQDGTASPGAYVPVPECDSGAGYTPLAAPVVDGAPRAVPGSLNLGTAASYATDEAVFVRVADADQNTDPLTAQAILVQMGAAATGDAETIRLTETGADTGVFTGYIQAGTAPAAADCQLSVAAGQPVTASYADVNDPADTADTSAPVAAAGGGIFLSNASMKSSASIGEVVPYQVELTNTAGTDIIGTAVTVSLPARFRYRSNSTTLDGSTIADPAVSQDGRRLTFAVGPVAADGTVTLRYVAAISAGARLGEAINSAEAAATGGFASNTAQAQVVVAEEPITSRGLIAGRVMIGSCQAEPAEGRVGLRLRSKAVGDRVEYTADVGVSSVAVEGLRVVVRVPEVLEYVPGTALLDGKALGDPVRDGNTLRFELGRRAADSDSVITFSTRSQLRVFGEFSTRASASFKTAETPLNRTPVAVNRLKDYSYVVRPRFDSLSADLKEQDMRDLDDLAAALAGHPVKRIYVVGHADSRPIRSEKNAPFSSNEALALARAERVAQYLDGRLKLGEDKFEVSGKAAQRPLYYDKRLEGRTLTAAERLALNRRVEVLVEVEGQHTNTRFLISKADSGIKSTEVFPSSGPRRDPTVGLGIPGAKGVRLYLEDGQFVETDDQGMYHFDGVRPGTHVVQVDTDSLPDHLEVDRCEENTRFAGTPYSRFVDVRAGSLWRADFYLKRKPPTVTEGSVGMRLRSRLDDEGIVYTLTATGDRIEFKDRRLMIHLPDGLEYIPGSARLDGEAVADPVRDGDAFVLGMEDTGTTEWKHAFSFRATGAQAQEGEYTTFAYMRFRTADGREHRSSVVETSLLRQAPSVRRLVYDATFKRSGVELSDHDRKALDGIIDYLREKSIRSVYVAAQSGNVPAAEDTGDGYPDSQELTAARAQEIGEYVSKALRLHPRQVRTAVVGTGEPAASQASTAGHSRERRVELYVTMADEAAAQSVNIKRRDSGLQMVEVVNSIRHEEKAPVAEPDSTEANDPLEEGILSVHEGERIATPVMALRVRLDTRLKPDLHVDGVKVSNEQIGFKRRSQSTGKTTYTYIGVNLGGPGAHTVELKGMDPFGNARVHETVNYVRTSEITEIRVVTTEGNAADGKTPVRIRIELRDQKGDVVNAGVKLRLKDSELVPYQYGEQMPELRTASDIVEVGADGEILFEPVSTSGTRTGRLSYNGVSTDFRTYIKPVYRKWIMVGVAEGTVAHKTLSGNMQNLSDADLADDFSRDGRLAFFAKGKIKGKYLLTLAYDSSKENDATQNGLFQQLDPNKYYTLYGDGTEQRAEAASSEKLYIKLESDQFYALFGDYNTGLTVTELSRYSRSLTGLKSEYKSERFNVNAFASDTGNAFVRDEIAGDGTSGLYQLSRKNILPNSDKVRIEVRDRFQSHAVIESRQLVRYVDYNIDPRAGTLYFREPVYSRDPNLNPVYIVAEYEVEGSGGVLSLGGRIGITSNEGQHELGVTAITQGNGEADGRLLGADGKLRLNENAELRAEIANSADNSGASLRTGNAYIAEVTYRTGKADVKAYVRQQDEGFGIGQQSISEAGTRKSGVVGKYQTNETTALVGEAYHNVNLDSGSTRDVLDGALEYKWRDYTLTAGYRHASDRNGGTTYESNLVTGSVVKPYYDERLKFHGNAELATGDNDNPDYPSRLLAGVDYKLTQKSTLFAEQELTFGSGQDSNTTRAGIKASPWSNAVVGSTIESQYSENGARVFTTTGLTQGFDVNPNLRADFGLERVQTLRDAGDPVFDPAVPPASGTRNADFTAASTGATYKKKKWSTTCRIELRDGEQYNKVGLLLGFYREQTPGFGVSGTVQHFDTDEATGNRDIETSIKFALAYRPIQSKWIVLNKLELSQSYDLAGAGETRLQKLVNNISANYMFTRASQFTVHYGYKRVVDTIDLAQYGGSTHFLRAEYRHDLRKDWDLGLHAGALQSQSGNNLEQSYGLSVGHSLARNTWLSVGYNFNGFDDEDFAAAGYTAAGPYVKLRLAFDHQTSRRAMAWWEKRRGSEQAGRPR